MLDEVKKAGRFVYMYQENDTVLVACERTGPFSREVYNLIEKKLDGKAKKIEDNMQLAYNGDEYIGILYKAIPELILYNALTR